MRIQISICYCLLVLFSCQETERTPNGKDGLGYIIQGTSKTEQGYAYLQKYNADNEIAIIDSVTLVDKSFIFKGQVAYLEPYQVVVNEEVYPLLLENTNYILTETAFKGSKFQEHYNQYYEGLRETENAFVYQRDFINSHPESMLAAVVLKTMLGKTPWRINQNELAYDALDESIKQSYLGKQIHKFILAQERLLKDNKEVASIVKSKELPAVKSVIKNEKVPKSRPVIKKTIPIEKRTEVVYTGVNFEADDINGDNFRLSDITTRSKYVLIDFWASWCAPCRKQNPYLVEVYNMFKDKGFDIVSVSEDRSKLAWQQAINDDGLKWHHVIDDFSRLTKLYNVESIPHTILINGKGEIIASDISPYMLKTKLGGLLRK